MGTMTASRLGSGPVLHAAAVAAAAGVATACVGLLVDAAAGAEHGPPPGRGRGPVRGAGAAGCARALRAHHRAHGLNQRFQAPATGPGAVWRLDVRGSRADLLATVRGVYLELDRGGTLAMDAQAGSLTVRTPPALRADGEVLSARIAENAPGHFQVELSSAPLHRHLPAQPTRQRLQLAAVVGAIEERFVIL